MKIIITELSKEEKLKMDALKLHLNEKTYSKVIKQVFETYLNKETALSSVITTAEIQANLILEYERLVKQLDGVTHLLNKLKI